MKGIRHGILKQEHSGNIRLPIRRHQPTMDKELHPKLKGRGLDQGSLLKFASTGTEHTNIPHPPEKNQADTNDKGQFTSTGHNEKHNLFIFGQDNEERRDVLHITGN